MPVDCTGCHGGNGASGSPLATGKHAPHVNNAAVLGDNLGCAECHAKTVSADRSISNTNNHDNTFVDYSGVNSGSSGSYSSATGVCSATYCHTDGKGTQKVMTVASWRNVASGSHSASCPGVRMPLRRRSAAMDFPIFGRSSNFMGRSCSCHIVSSPKETTPSVHSAGVD